MPLSIQTQWDQRYIDQDCSEASPASVLCNHHYLLPASGTALDLACGLGGNAIFLAQQGLTVTALDVSVVAVTKLKQFAKQEGLSIKPAVRDIEADGLGTSCYDTIVVSFFLCRPLMPKIIDALKPGGVLFYQTWTQQKVQPGGPNNSDFLLAPQELRQFADDLDLHVYQEAGLVGDLDSGLRNQATLVAGKR